MSQSHFMPLNYEHVTAPQWNRSSLSSKNPKLWEGGLTVIRFSLIGASLMSGFGLIAEGNMSPPIGLSGTAFGWATSISTIALAFMFFLDRRKIAAANALNEIIAGKDSIIAGKDELIAHLKDKSEGWEKESKAFQDDLTAHRKMHHDYQNEMQAKLLAITAENSRLRVLIAEKGISMT